MLLEEYYKKRDFNKTPEPTGGLPSEEQPIFVVQWHNASHLHYDFRLELNGVLKSWAVPKGPSMNHSDKRLAVMTEDHPIDYAKFEGFIPKGEYGGGEVRIWDSGTWESIDEDPQQALQKGALKFTLHGDKLKGAFALIRMTKVKNGWLLIKEKDEFMVSTPYNAQETY